MHKKQSSSEQVTIEIKSKLQTFNRNIQKNISSNLGNPLKWYIENVTKDKTPNVPRISILQEALKTLRQTIPDKRILNEIFLQEKSVNEIIFESQHFVDMAFVLRQHLALKMNKKVQYASIIMDTIHNKLSYFFQKQKQKLASLLRVNHVFSFIEFKKVGMQQIYDKISEFELKQLREEVSLMYTFLIKPWLQKRTPSKYYEELSDIIYWNVIIQDDTQQRQQMIIGLNEKISNYFCSRKRSDNAFNYVKLFGYLLDILSVNYRKQDPFKIYGLAPLMNLWQQEIQIDQITIWLQNKGKQLKPQQVQNIFRNTYHVGSTIFMFNLIEKFSKALKAKNEFNILYHLYLSYIKKEYLDISLPNQTFINTYFQILEFYVIGFINQDRLDGESELDKLTKNISSFLLDKKFTYRKHHDTVIMFYKVYEARFSYLSSISRKFVSDLQRLYKYYPQLSDIHNKIHRGVFRQANMNDDENSGFQQLNIKRTDRYRGMMNLGNTCYMNSFMQAMFMTKKFRSTVLDIRDQQSLPSSKTLFYALSNLFTEMSTKTIGNDSEIIPQLFKMQTPEPFKSSWDQHDVAQFGRMYFQSLMNELQDNSTKERMQKIFFNKIRKSLICYNCKNQKSNLEQVFDFILHLNKKDDSISVSRLLGEYFQGQQMVGENQVYCDRCRKNTNASAIPHPVKFAQFLIISIGLFEYSGGGKKIKKPFNFQFNINFSKILPNENVPDDNYELYAFIVHIGNQSERGHYICYARNLQENPTIWYCFDDGYVTERQIENVQKFQFGESQTPYLLFYSASKKRKSIQNINFDKLGSQLFSK